MKEASRKEGSTDDGNGHAADAGQPCVVAGRQIWPQGVGICGAIWEGTQPSLGSKFDGHPQVKHQKQDQRECSLHIFLQQFQLGQSR